jgi:hypothetical protein
MSDIPLIADDDKQQNLIDYSDDDADFDDDDDSVDKDDSVDEDDSVDDHGSENSYKNSSDGIQSICFLYQKFSKKLSRCV